MPLKFIHALKQHFERSASLSLKTVSSDGKDSDWSRGAFREDAEYASVEYQRYHYGSAPGPFY